MKKKNGYALIMSVVVISLLLIFSTTILTLSTLAYKGTKKFEETNKLKLVAESGIEKGKTILKNYLLANTGRYLTPTSTFNYLTFNPYEINAAFGADLSYTEDDITCTITFLPNDPLNSTTFADVSTGRNISYIEIQAEAENVSTGTSKTFSVVLDKAAISNIYFDQIFKSAITVAGPISNDTYVSVNIKDTSNIDLSGNVYLQGSLINLLPGLTTFANNLKCFDEKKITVNSNVLKTEIDTLSSMELLKDTNTHTNTNTADFKNWHDSTIKKLKILEIYDPATGSIDSAAADPIHDLTILSVPTDLQLQNFVKFQEQKDPFTGISIGVGPPTLVTYKVTSGSTSPVNFKRIIDGSDGTGSTPGIYKSIIETLITRAKAENDAAIPARPPLTDLQANKKAEDDYGKFYKLILVDGDLIIEDNNTENFVNYIVYCTGKVTFEGEAHLYNASIFSEELETGGLIGKKIELFGVNTTKASNYAIGGEFLSDFNPIDKMIINNYLINNLDGYADSLYYKIVQWK